MLYTHTFRPPAFPKNADRDIRLSSPAHGAHTDPGEPPKPSTRAPARSPKRRRPQAGSLFRAIRTSSATIRQGPMRVRPLFPRGERGKGVSGLCLGPIVSLCESMQAGRPASSISRQDSSPEWPSDRLDFLLSQRPFPQKDDRTKELPCGRRRPTETRNGHPSAHQVCYGMGNRTVKVVPTPISLATLTSPPYKPAMCLTMDNPRPVPPSSRLRPLSTR